jgi:hypothetical protein
MSYSDKKKSLYKDFTDLRRNFSFLLHNWYFKPVQPNLSLLFYTYIHNFSTFSSNNGNRYERPLNTADVQNHVIASVADFNQYQSLNQTYTSLLP